MTNELCKAAEMALETAEAIVNAKWQKWDELATPEEFERWAKSRAQHMAQALRQALAQTKKPPVKSYCGGKPNYCTPVDAVPGFTATEPRQSLSKMKPGDRFVLVRTSEIYHIKQDGSQWNDTRQRPARLHKNSQVRLIVTHPKCDDACMNICTEGFTKPPTCNTPVDAVNISQERVNETAKCEHEPVAWMWKDGSLTSDPDYADNTWTPLYTAPAKPQTRVGEMEWQWGYERGWDAAMDQKHEEKNT